MRMLLQSDLANRSFWLTSRGRFAETSVWDAAYQICLDPVLLLTCGLSRDVEESWALVSAMKSGVGKQC